MLIHDMRYIPQAPTAPAEPTIGQLIDAVLPGALTAGCPAWPPDVFAIAASIMRRTGAYVHCLSGRGHYTDSSTQLLDRDWPDRAQTTGAEWRKAVCDALRKHAGSGKLRVGDAVERAHLPRSVTDAWAVLRRHSGTPVRSSATYRDLSKALLELSGYADEASFAIGLGRLGGEQDEFGKAGRLFLQLKGKQSFCHKVDPLNARVLGKKHTPQQGLTLRSITHHLSLCMPWEVEPLWFDLDSPRLDGLLNLLLLPWPEQVDARDFRRLGDGADGLESQEHCFFEYKRKPMTPAQTRKRINEAVAKAYQRVSKLHAIVLPELALTRSEWTIAEKIAGEHGVMLISGIMDDVDEATGLPTNSCRIQMMSLPSRRPHPKSGHNRFPPAFRQAKHHRWCLDRNQVLQYDLGGQLPSALRCWENSHIGSRRIFFAHLGGWLTFSVLICEDLARQDPIADVLRSVGPNLVIALLMDGPQHAARWPARYAAVLADDPGTSVLTLTSLGMCLRSRRAADHKNGSRVIALWKDKLYGSREIALPEASSGCVLSLARETREEFTADGRGDDKATEVPVFSGIFPL